MLDPTELNNALRRLTLPVRLTQLGMLVERAVRALWPLASIVVLSLSMAMLGLQDHLSLPVFGCALLAVFAAVITAVVFAIRRWRWPSRAAAQMRLDDSLQGAPIQTLLDRPVIGGEDADSAALWQAHLRRAMTALHRVRPVAGDLRLASRDPYALRYGALLAFVMALLFGSVWRIGSVSSVILQPEVKVASGPVWEGWVEPPAYTQLPALYLNDLESDILQVPSNSLVTLRFYGDLAAISLQQTVSDAAVAGPQETAIVPDPQQTAAVAEFSVATSGQIVIEAEGGRSWTVQMTDDAPPRIALTQAPDVTALGVMSLPYHAQDDYGVTGGQVVIALDWDKLDRRFGLRVDPEPRPEIALDLSLPISGDRRDFSDVVIQDFSQHPWSNLPVLVAATVTDLMRQQGAAAAFEMRLPGRRFFDPLAAAVIELRRDLLWSGQNAAQVAVVLRAISHRPEDLFRSEVAYLRLRMLLHRLESLPTDPEGAISAAQRDEIAQGLWGLALLLEDGELTDALARLQRAQDRLSEAMKNGASDAEIAELMQEFRDASEAYMRQLGQQQAQEDAPQSSPSDNNLSLDQNDLQRMMDRIQELMEQGRMAEAQQALEQLRQMMENMQVTEGQGQGQGEGGQSQGQQSLDGLADTLRDQQGLSDDAFRDLQKQTNPQSPPGVGSGQPQLGAPPQGDQSQGGLPQGEQPQANPDGAAQTLAERQRDLRRELQRQRQALPPEQGGSDQATREALERADEAMQGAEDALRSNDLAEAINQQSKALDALRNGLEALGEAVSEANPNSSEDGQQSGQQTGQGSDPLGRQRGTSGESEIGDTMLNGEDVYRRARDLLDEIRRRSGEGERSDIERDYLERLLERF